MCAVEQLYSNYTHPRTAILMAHARGVILLAAEQARGQGGPAAHHAQGERAGGRHAECLLPGGSAGGVPCAPPAGRSIPRKAPTGAPALGLVEALFSAAPSTR